MKDEKKALQQKGIKNPSKADMDALRQKVIKIKRRLEEKIEFFPGFVFTSENILKVADEIDKGLLFGDKWRLKV